MPVVPFSVDNLPMSDAALGIWASLVRLAGTGEKTTGTADQENFQLPAVPGGEGVGTARCPPVRPLLSPRTGGLIFLHCFNNKLFRFVEIPQGVNTCFFQSSTSWMDFK